MLEHFTGDFTDIPEPPDSWDVDLLIKSDMERKELKKIHMENENQSDFTEYNIRPLGIPTKSG